MQFSIQQQAAHRNLSYVVAEKIAHSILSGQYAAESILKEKMSSVKSTA